MESGGISLRFESPPCLRQAGRGGQASRSEKRHHPVMGYKKGCVLEGVLFSLVACVVVLCAFVALPVWGAEAMAKNVIVLIADGASSEQYTLTRWYKGAPLATDEILVGAIKTYIADSVVADSAPAATAYATGYRTSDKFISVGPKAETISPVPTPGPEVRYRPLATVLEGARLLGKATGIVVTSRISHATPAAYMAHVPSREMEDDIMEQAVYQGIDVAFGGGKLHLLGKGKGGNRQDNEDLMEVLKALGYQLVESRGEMLSLTAGKVFGIFARSHMEPEIDRETFAPEQPTLEEMTRKAIELLSQDPDGFFLMVEASQVDWACHANDPAHMLNDLMQFDKAVAVALEFARRDGNTLVLAVSDHNTGGMSIGNRRSDKTYSQMKVEALLDPLRRMNLSAWGIWRRMGDERTPERLQALVRLHWGMDISAEEADEILAVSERYRGEPHYALGETLCPRHTYVGFTSHGHVGGDVPLFAFGPGRPSGLLDAPDLGNVTARAMGLDLRHLNARLFVDATIAFDMGEITVEKTWGANPVVLVEHKGRKAQLPLNKNLLKMDGQEIPLEGVTVFIRDTGRAYLPLQAVQMIKGEPVRLPEVRQVLPGKGLGGRDPLLFPSRGPESPVLDRGSQGSYTPPQACAVTSPTRFIPFFPEKRSYLRSRARHHHLEWAGLAGVFSKAGPWGETSPFSCNAAPIAPGVLRIEVQWFVPRGSVHGVQAGVHGIHPRRYAS